MSTTLNQLEILKQQQGNSMNKPPASLLASNLYRKGRASDEYIPFHERVEKRQDLCALEMDPNATKVIKQKKKHIESYNKNRDKLFIPKPERPKRPIDINKNLIEDPDEKVTADIGMQSDQINYTNMEKDFLPQKIGKDQGTQILDGELFCFDKDVMPLLTVLIGKTFEQSLNELAQEDEIFTLRETKKMYDRKNEEERKRIRNLEDREIQKKFNNDIKKDRRKHERDLRKKTQQVLMSRVISKAYMKNLLSCSVNDLVGRGQFKNYTTAIVKNETNRKIKYGSEKLSFEFSHLRSYLGNVLTNRYDLRVSNHKKSVDEHREMLRVQKEEADRKKREDEERRIQEDIARKERRRQRKIERIKKEIKEAIINIGVEKGDFYQEEISEVDNFGRPGPYIGIYGSALGVLLLTISTVRRRIFQQDTLYTLDNMIDILTIYFTDFSGAFPIVFTENTIDMVKDIKEDIDVANLKTNTDLEDEEWEKIAESLSDIENNGDYILHHFLEEFKEDLSEDLYPLFIKAIFALIQKGTFLDRITLIFQRGADEEEEEGEGDEGKPKKAPVEDDNDEEEEGQEKEKAKPTFEELFTKYEAFCEIGMHKKGDDLLNDLDFTKKKRGMKVGEFDLSARVVKAYQKVPEHNILLHDQTVEFILRNKMFESCLVVFASALGTEMDAQPLYRIFNEGYDEILSKTTIQNVIQNYVYEFEEEKPEEEEEQE